MSVERLINPKTDNFEEAEVFRNKNKVTSISFKDFNIEDREKIDQVLTISNQYQDAKLPEKLSDLIDIAIEDMKKAINSGYRIYMQLWGSGKTEEIETCSVCLAGSVMLRSNAKKLKFLSELEWLFIGDYNWKRFNALNCIRIGKLIEALRNLDIEIKDFEKDWLDKAEKFSKAFKYEEGKEQKFYGNLIEIRDYLRLVNL